VISAAGILLCVRFLSGLWKDDGHEMIGSASGTSTYPTPLGGDAISGLE
jgi:hypothetical protein